MDNIGIGITVIIVCFIAFVIILKLCSKFVYLRYFLMICSAIATVVVGFAMPEMNGKFDLSWAAGQFACIFAFVVFTFAEMAFDKEDYTEREIRETSTDRYAITDRRKTRGLFWTAVGTGAGIAAIIVVVNYIFFPNNAIAIGVVGCIALVWTAISVIKYIRWKYRLTHGPKDYY